MPFKPDACPQPIADAIHTAATKYNLPAWWLFSIVARESYFKPTEYNPNGGYGLTQLTGTWYVGQPWPYGLTAPDDNHIQYGYDMNFAKYGKWILMSQVSRLDDPFNPAQNLDRFCTGYAVGFFNVLRSSYPIDGYAVILRMAAFSWNKGVYAPYDPANQDYLRLYDAYVLAYKGPCEAEDGIWEGQPRLTVPPAPVPPGVPQAVYDAEVARRLEAETRAVGAEAFANALLDKIAAAKAALL